MTDLSLPPNAGEFERAVLGSLLIDAPMFGEVNKIIKTPSAFYEHKHGWIYAAITKIAKRKENVDLLTVSMQLAKDNLLHECGGESYLADLVNTVPTALNIITYANEVAGKYISRKIFLAAQELSRLAYDNADVDSKRVKAKSLITTALEGSEQSTRLSWADAVDGFMDGLYERVYGDAQTQFSFGIAPLDTMMGDALEPGNLIIIAAKKKRGKSTLMRTHALFNAKADHGVGIFSYEEREFNVVKTMLAREAMSTTSAASLRTMVNREGRENEAAAIYKKLLDKAAELKRLPIHTFYSGNWIVEDCVSEMERLRDLFGVRLFAVDYVQIIPPSKNTKERRLDLAHISGSLARAAKDLGVLILLGSQVNDEGRAREAEDIENDCDAKILITADDSDIILQRPGKPIPVTLKVELNRHGPTGAIDAMFNGAYGTFVEAIKEPLGSAFK